MEPTYGPPRSPDLTPLDFHFWGHLRTLVCNTRPLNANDLKLKVIDGCNNIRGEELQNIYRSIIRKGPIMHWRSWKAFWKCFVI